MNEKQNYASRMSLDNIPDIFSIDYRDTCESLSKQPHIHEWYEVTLVLSKDIQLHVNDRVIPVPAHSLLLFNNMDLHRIIRSTETEFCRYVLQFRPEYLEHLNQHDCDLFDCFYIRPFENAHVLTLNGIEYDVVKQLLERLDQIAHSSGLYGQEVLQRLVCAEVLVFINGVYRRRHIIGNSYGNENYDAVYGLLRYIHSHLSDDLSIAELAHRALMGERSLSAVFKTVTGMTPAHYVLHCRIAKAKSLLAENCPVERACERAGFGNVNHFSRIFRKYTGESPKQYGMRMRWDTKGIAEQVHNLL